MEPTTVYIYTGLTYTHFEEEKYTQMYYAILGELIKQKKIDDRLIQFEDLRERIGNPESTDLMLNILEEMFYYGIVSKSDVNDYYGLT